MQPTRRDALITLAAIAVPAADAQPTFLSAAELDWLKSLVDAIIPRTDTPGAADAGVHLFIDRRLAGNPQLAEAFRAGMKSFDAASTFPSLTTQQKLDQLIAHEQDPFIRSIKNLTIDGYYSSREGLADELGWHGNTFLTEFKGCTHPEHQS